jgi:hypothetical protein
MTGPVNMGWSLGIALDHHRYQGDQQRPRREYVDIKQRDAEEVMFDIEQGEQWVVEQQAAEQKQGDQPLAIDAGSFHGCG